jgi:hypothetical protein
MVFNAIFKNISAISCLSVLMVEETERHDIAEIFLKMAVLGEGEQGIHFRSRMFICR